MKKDLLEKIKKRGYWRVNFQPLVCTSKLASLGECRDVIKKYTVELRGWDYPHFPRRQANDSGLELGNNYYQGWIDWGIFKEFWRMYQSGQFIQYLALTEDWYEEDVLQLSIRKDIKPLSSLGIVGSVTYQMTEVFEFLSRLGSKGIYDEGVFVSIDLHNTENRTLWIEDGSRGLISRYTTNLSKIEFSKECTKEQIVTDSKELALEVIEYIFDRFGWHSPPIETIKKDQNDLLSGKFL